MRSAATLPATADTTTARGRRTTMNATASTIGYRTRDELRHPDEKALERIGQVPEEAQEVALEALEGTLVGDRDEQPEEEHDRGRGERQQLDR